MFGELHIITQAYGKMLNICDESEQTIVNPEYENALKKYTGGTPFTFKHFYKPPISDYPTAKVMITSNHRPPFKDTSDGVWRRILMLEFNCVPKHVIHGLSDIIAKTELPGVLAWALKGIKSLQENGDFCIPTCMKQDIEEYKNEAHPERKFILDNFEKTDNQDHNPLCKTVRKLYEMYANENNYGLKNEHNFGKSMRSVYPFIERVRRRKGGTLVYVYDGIRIKTDSEYYDTFMKMETL
jgi:putative DNA primase/helicase